MKNNVKNEKIKRRFFRFMKEAEGYSETTINSIEKAIWLYEDYTKHEDYGKFNSSKAIGFKNSLLGRKHKGKPVSSRTVYHYLRYLTKFFVWLSGQPGYKSKIQADNISYLSLDKKKVREILSPKPVKFPTLEYVMELTKSFKINTEIDQRDRALIAFLLLSGMRHGAIISLPLGCFDRDNFEIKQDHGKGVNTKFGKSFNSTLFRFNDDLLNYVIDWAKYLEKRKLFNSANPLFPRNKIEQIPGGLAFTSRDVEPEFWRATNRLNEILKNRAKQADLEYYRPHSFRHAAVHLALKNCQNAEQIKAVSQNFGHEFIATTMTNYGNLDSFRVKEIIDNMEYAVQSDGENDQEILDKAMKIIMRNKKTT